MKCTQCGAELVQGGVFCGMCGWKVEYEEQVGQVSPAAGTAESEVSESAANAVSMVEAVPDSGPATPPVKAPIPEPNVKKHDFRKMGMIAVAGVAAVLLVILAASRFSTGKKPSDESKLLYYKEETIMMADLKHKAGAVEITDAWCEGEENAIKSSFIYQDIITRDGSYLYYLEDYDHYVYDLFKAPVANLEKAEKIDSNVDRHIILDNNQVIYRKKGSYYYYDGKNKAKFGKNVGYIYLNEAQTAVMWGEGSGYENMTLYYQPLDQKTGKVQLEKNVDEFYFNKELSSIYTYKKGTLTKIANDGTKETLASKINSLVNVDADNGSFYYTKSDTHKLTLKDHVYTDKGQTMDPDKLASGTVKIPTTELYYFAKGKETLVSDNISTTLGYNEYSGTYCMYYAFTDWESLELPFSKVSGRTGSALEDAILHEMSKTGGYQLAVGDKIYHMDEQIDSLSGIRYAEDDNLLYMILTYKDEDDEKILAQVPLSGSSTGTITEIDQDVEQIAAVGKKNVYYFKDYDGYSGDLYSKGKYLLPDVYSAYYLEDAKKVACLVDYDEDDGCGSIVIHDGNNSKHVADDVAFFEAAADGTLRMMADYDYEDWSGDLLYYDGKETRFIDDDVNMFVMRYEGIWDWRLYYQNFYGYR